MNKFTAEAKVSTESVPYTQSMKICRAIIFNDLEWNIGANFVRWSQRRSLHVQRKALSQSLDFSFQGSYAVSFADS